MRGSSPGKQCARSARAVRELWNSIQPGSDETPGEHVHIVSPKIYVAIFLALLVLTGTTVAVSYIDLGVFNPVVALAIACIKMVLVVLFFMHVKYSSKLTKLTVISGVFIFLGADLDDPGGLHEPRLGQVVGRQFSVVSCQ